MIKDISDFNIIPGIFLFYQLAGPKWWILSLWEEQMIFSVGRKQHGGSHLLPSGGMVVSSGASFGRRQESSNTIAVLQVWTFGFFLFWGLFFFLRFFSSHLSHQGPQSYFSPIRKVSVEADAWPTSPLGKAKSRKRRPCQKVPMEAMHSPTSRCPHPAALPRAGPAQHLPPWHPLPSPSKMEVDPTACLPGTGILTRQHPPLVFK